MTPYKKQRLIVVGLSLLSISLGVGFFLFAFKDNLVYFYGPSELPQNLKPQQIIRVGGLVEKGSLQHLKDPVGVRFRITDGQSSLQIEFHGILPDLFREGQGVVAEGTLTSLTHFVAQRVLAKHDETYMPPEVQHSLDTASKQALQKSLK
jgi:cytochrome c-type biogenesis protein CcmE